MMTAILLAVSKYGDSIRLDFLAKHFAKKRGYKYREKLKFLSITGLSAFASKLMIILMDHKTRMQYCFLAVKLSYMYPA